MKKELYENTYKNDKHFSFGKNWQDFSKTISDERVREAQKSLADFLGSENIIKGKSFVDIGCGSGLFSLAALLLGASKVVSVDIDDFSIQCTQHLKEKQHSPSEWSILKGSALDDDFLKSLGQFDIVYSWGVLHHSGNMYKAMKNTVELVSSSGLFYLAIYNNNKNKIREGTSKFWSKIKQRYNRSGKTVKKTIYWIYVFYFIIGLIISGRNPIRYIKNYKSNRGMSWHHDIIDWLGGYPYEYASPDEIINFFGERNICCKKLIYRDSIGCSEYLLIKNG
jgi:2-polyprenyl-6-hydroxyphenyl methylase/3-demethylubiquinone-9 3-methyltransferase